LLRPNSALRWRSSSFAVAQHYLGHLHKDAVLEVQRSEQVRPREQHLRPAQEQVAVVIEGKVEAGQDAVLGLGVEIHQRVAAHQQVQA
jgi:hypothetical protein